MGIYKELNINTIINASDTYTRLGGSRMSDRVISAMNSAAKNFVDLDELAAKVNNAIAKMTNNKSAFVSSGCGACVVLASAVLMTEGDAELGKKLPDVSGCKKTEFVIFAPQTEIESLPYWKLIALSGGTVVTAEPTIQGLKAAVTKRCAGIWYFDGTLYQEGIPTVEETIKTARLLSVPILIDAAAQIPPISNLWYYTKDLGADGAVFSGGKFIMGPQSTGFFVGRQEISDACHALANPNVGIGRPYKVGKEEYAGIYEAVKQLVACDENQRRVDQNRCLDIVEQALSPTNSVEIQRLSTGRLGQDAPRLIIRLPKGRTGQQCAEFLYTFVPAVDIGYFLPSDPSGKSDEIFVNSISLSEAEAEYVASCLKTYLLESAL